MALTSTLRLEPKHHSVSDPKEPVRAIPPRRPNPYRGSPGRTARRMLAHFSRADRHGRRCADRRGAELRGASRAAEVSDLGILVHAAVSYTHLRAHETDSYLVCRLLLE